MIVNPAQTAVSRGVPIAECTTLTATALGPTPRKKMKAKKRPYRPEHKPNYVNLTEIQRDIIEHLKSSFKRQSYDTISHALGIDRTTVGQEINKMIDAGAIRKVKKGYGYEILAERKE